jgi:hypothetical protein
LLFAPTPARAVTMRRVFEPTDLEFEDPGVAQLDMQYGLVRGQDAFRVSAPDFELDLGLTQNVELDLDGEFAVGGPDDGAFRIDRLAQDNLWSALKVGFQTFEDTDDATAWSFGAQLGPVWPLAPDAQGVGVAGLALAGYRLHENYFALNLGGFTEPADGPDLPRAHGFAGGIDAEIPLDHDDQWALTAELAGVAYGSPDPDQLSTTLGLQWSVRDDLDVSITALRGWLPGGDQYAVLIGVTPRFRVW